MAMVVLLVVAGLGVGGYFLFAGSDKRPAAAPGDNRGNQPATVPTTTEPLTPEEKFLASVPKPPGAANSDSGLHSVSELVELGVVGKKEADIITNAPVDVVAWRGSRKQPNEFGPEDDKFSVTVIPVPDSSTAESIAKKMTKHHISSGMVEIPESLPDIPEPVRFVKRTEKDPGIYLGIWTSDKRIVRVQVTQDPLDNEKALSGSYQRAVKSLLKSFPVSG